jgi:hypothetical protein
MSKRPIDEKTYELHYASLDLDTSKEDIPVFEFNTKQRLLDKIIRILSNSASKKDCVFIVGLENESILGSEVIVTDNAETIQNFIVGRFYHNHIFNNNSWYIHEYPSFEEAYKIALAIREGHRLCYTEDAKEISN